MRFFCVFKKIKTLNKNRYRKAENGRGELWHEAYNFVYHPTTSKYKVVHVPYRWDRIFEFKTVQVLMLGKRRGRMCRSLPT